MRGERQHVLEMNRAERRLANREHELALLLENDVRGTMNQVVTESVRDRRE